MGSGDSKSTKRLIIMITLTENVKYCREKKKETFSFSGAGTFIHPQNALVCQMHVTQVSNRLTALLTDAH